MAQTHNYDVTIEWTGNKGVGTDSYTGYERSHNVMIEGKPDILCSSDPNFRGDAQKHNPEELFLASLSSCHMLWYLHLCATHNIVVQKYTDRAKGTMVEDGDRGGRFTEVTLQPHVVIQDASKIAIAQELHKQANQLCYIANSCNFPIGHKAICEAIHV